MNTKKYLAIGILALAGCSKNTVDPVPSQTLTITDFSPHSALIGADVTITGSGFDPVKANNVVKVNGANAEVTSSAANGKSLVITVPVGATSGKITVTVKGNTATSADDITITSSDVYANYRVKEIDYSDGTIYKYFYDANNRLTKEKTFIFDANTNTTSLNDTTVFDFTASGDLVEAIQTYVGRSVYKTEYIYDQSVLQKITLSKALIVGGVIGQFDLQNTQTYVFENGRIASMVSKNGNDQVTYQNTYAYTTANGNLQQTVHYVPASGPPYDGVSIFDLSETDPFPNPYPDSPIHYFQKSYTFSVNHNLDYNNSRILDVQGRIETLTEDYPNHPAYSYSCTYVYELKQ